MHDASDMELLRDYDRKGSEAAFAVLVERHVSLVYSAALRHVGIAAHAEEITQAVFIILARKAVNLRPNTTLEGWLFETTRLTALSFLRGERRRQFREQEAYMQSTVQENNDAATWNQLAPLLDEAVSRLGKKDRDAVMLRFFKDKNLREVAAALRMNETAAQRRVHRAVEKLRGFFTKRGIVLPAAVLTAVISANSVQAAPVALAKAVTAVAVAKGAAAGGSTLILVKGASNLMAWAKMKIAGAVGAAMLLSAGIVVVSMTTSETANGTNLTPQEIVKRAQTAYAALSSYSGTGRSITKQGNQIETIDFSIRLQRPNLYRIEWSQAQVVGSFSKNTSMTSNSSKGIIWSSGSGDFVAIPPSGKPNQERDMPTNLGFVRGVSGEASTAIPGAFFGLTWPGYGESVLNPTNSTLQKQKDEFVGGVDCYVILSGRAGRKTLWIGKQDYLIRQFRTIHQVFNAPRSDSELTNILVSQKIPVTPQAIATLRTGLRQIQNVIVDFTQTHESISVNQKFSPADFEAAQ